ncbi:MAG TPA: TetR family transcriptional regulator [candidate division Zixibacteria bacterium]|nr:TetR family transcriptional regulator [candidate division Zixibacteria bacterium]
MRNRILEAALMEFAERGVAGARVDRIAARAGVNKALIYYYYTSKQRLYEESISSYMRALLDSVRLSLDEASNLEEALHGVAERYSSIFLTRPEIPRLMMRELANPGNTLVSQWAERITASGVPATIRRRLEAGREAGEVRPIDLRQAFVSFLTMQIGYFLMSPLVDRVLHLEDREAFVVARRDAVVDLFLNGVKAR